MAQIFRLTGLPLSETLKKDLDEMTTFNIEARYDIYKLRKYLLKLRRNNFSFDKAILFGSYAKGKAGSNSDIDLCIVSSKFGKDMHKETVRLTSFVSDTNFPIDVVSYKPQELNDKYDPLASEIRNFGIEV